MSYNIHMELLDGSHGVLFLHSFTSFFVLPLHIVKRFENQIPGVFS
jgi:hypothetical protein